MLVYVFTKNIKNRQMHPLMQKYVSILCNQVSLAQFHMDRAIFGSRLQTNTAVGDVLLAESVLCHLGLVPRNGVFIALNTVSLLCLK